MFFFFIVEYNLSFSLFKRVKARNSPFTFILLKRSWLIGVVCYSVYGLGLKPLKRLDAMSYYQDIFN